MNLPHETHRNDYLDSYGSVTTDFNYFSRIILFKLAFVSLEVSQGLHVSCGHIESLPCLRAELQGLTDENPDTST